MNSTEVILAIIGSNALFTFITFLINRYDNKKKDKNDELKRQSDMLLGLGHDRIIYLGSKYIERKYITRNEYEDLVTYLYKPYKALGGNGTAEKLMSEIEALEFREK